MKIVVQRVRSASVTVDNEVIGSINKGFLLLVGIGHEDTKEDAARLAKKISSLRIFSDENDKTNLSVLDVGGELLVVSQFTLMADCSHGNRPSFTSAAKPDVANALYEFFVEECRKYISNVQTGEFGADMLVSIENDGPFTVILE